MPSFGGDVKPLAPCTILQHVKEPLCKIIMHPINAQVFQKYPCPFIINDHIYMPKYQCSASHVQYTVMLIHSNNSAMYNAFRICRNLPMLESEWDFSPDLE
jgi:hypothetical protein